MPEYPAAVGLYALAAVLELAAEPVWIFAQANLFASTKVRQASTNANALA